MKVTQNTHKDGLGKLNLIFHEKSLNCLEQDVKMQIEEVIAANMRKKNEQYIKTVLETPGNKNPEIGNKVPSSGNTKRHFHGYNGIVEALQSLSQTVVNQT